MYVEVTESYRRPYVESGLEFMINGDGFGKVIRDYECKSLLGTLPPTPQFEVEWADGTTTVISKSHLKPSSKKAFFQARLSCTI